MRKKKALNRVAKRWVAALRSGNIKQTTQHLGRDSGSRCCLGVLCDLAVKAKVIPNYDIFEPTLPRKVQTWAGLRTEDGNYTNRLGYNTELTSDNDKSKKSFAKIADIIESQPDGLFK
jgi:hypothetical protein